MLACTLAISKTIILTNGPNDQSSRLSWSESTQGVGIQVKGRNLVMAREARMLRVARSYAHTIIGLTRSGLDRAQIACKLWESCAIPAVLYGTEAMTVSGGFQAFRPMSTLTL